MAQENEKEIQQLKNRFRDLADKSYSQGIYTFTGFLGLGELDIFYQMERELGYAGFALNGGCEGADRKMVRFGEEEQLGYELPFPIVCIRISPVNVRFADELSHRDFLGALMNLGIERSTVGDIRVGEKEACLFCVDSIAPFICENLAQVRHTHVKCSVTEDSAHFPQEEPVPVNIQVQSLRVDAVIARVYNMSREKSLDLFRAGKVYVEGRLCENNSRLLKPSETVNARGYGKFRIVGEPRETRKGKQAVDVAVYR
ncbi:MAG: YlmH/Sll1252 family protein [Lachnospiraceae bacterium]|nr:YlmH/Sll1252 family protein [Butyrivibrio sp.]MCM1343512.1 YlmH/Sll1252 family protein [Muribaculaceae bacterium]MCM1409065.1 YlmH/Sll1252 family protein [Lachnospiraceae bacterium]